MKNIRTIDFLPTIFRTSDNRKFLRATMDQLIQEPKFKATQGFIGRKTGEIDNYVTAEDGRSDYQLEPGIVFKKPQSAEISDAVTYPEIVDALAYYGANTEKADRLFAEEYYAWDPFVDLDKLVNYSQYYWLPNGPSSVNVAASDVPLIRDFDILRGGEYKVVGEPSTNPIITLIRGGAYTFRVDQLGHPFYIQSTPGASGTLPHSPNISSREVLGVQDNGADVGEIIFNVPAKTAQVAYHNMPEAPAVDLFTTMRFDQIHNVKLSVFLQKYGGVDGIQALHTLTLAFDENLLGWNRLSFFDDTGSGYSTAAFDQTTPVAEAEQHNVWRIVYFNEDPSDTDPILTLQPSAPIPVLSKFKILYGDVHANRYYFKNAEARIRPIPLLTATQDVLYYQDATDPELFGEIRIVDAVGDQKILISDIVGKTAYTSGNGVAFTNGLKVRFQGVIEPASFLSQDFYVEGVGESITLRLADEYITPERYARAGSEPLDTVPFDIYGYDASSSMPLDHDYITINRASPDRNAWSRSNRWFHRDVLAQTAAYNNTFYSFDNAMRAKRPIVEFRAGIQLAHQGAASVAPVDIVDFRELDALSNVQGSAAYGTDGYVLVQGSRVIFAADRDAAVRNKVYTVRYSDINLNGEFQLLLDETDEVAPSTNVLALRGISAQGKTYFYDGTTWAPGQLKTKVNQAPLFDIFDHEGVSLSNSVKYLSTTFRGTTLFGYSAGVGPLDPVLLLPLEYQSIDNIGDIVFKNYYHSDIFTYVANESGRDATVDRGRVRQNGQDGTPTMLNGWSAAHEEMRQSQVFLFTGGGTEFAIDIEPLSSFKYPAVKIYVDDRFVSPEDYIFENRTVVFNNAVPAGIPVQIKVVSKSASAVGFYETPINLERNPFNENAKALSLGTIRAHYSSIAENCFGIAGDIIGPNNFRDLGRVLTRGTAVVQHSAPLSILGAFLVRDNYNLFDSLEYNAREYEKFKAQMLNVVATTDWGFATPAQILDAVIDRLAAGKTAMTSFYWTDMCPAGDASHVSRTVVTPISTNIFDTFTVYDLTAANYSSIQVYVNDRLLARDRDYSVALDGPRVTIHSVLAVGDTVTIREYSESYGSFVPNTPTKLGLYNAWTPEKYIDTSYITPQEVVRGHDGSITLAFGDVRDDVLLEFERRVYNNLKVQHTAPVNFADVAPGQFRETDYSRKDIRNIVDPMFLAWSGWHRIDHKTQDYRSENEFTWNYTESDSKLDKEQLFGNWRAIYQWYYDTDEPHARPWEMLGFSDKPQWWENAYGPAPYTSGNDVLWDDLTDGFVADPLNTHTRPERARPMLKKVLPVDSSGNLLSPHKSIVDDYAHNSWRKSWAAGDMGPAENAWRRSSAWPFAVQRILALTEPAKYFAFAIDRDTNVFDHEVQQYVYNGYQRLSPKTVMVPDQEAATHSFLNWIVDYGRTTGIDAAKKARDLLASEDVRLCYRVGGYTDKPYFRVFTEQSSPGSLSRSLALPEESFHVLLHKNQPFKRIRYSAVIVQRVEGGYAVSGYSATQPFFITHTPVFNAVSDQYTDGSTTIKVPRDYNAIDRIIPYGTVYPSVDGLVTFLISYGKRLEAEGIAFDHSDGRVTVDWPTMGREVLHWSRQNWPVGSIITLNPVSVGLTASQDFGAVDSLVDNTPENVLLSQNKTQLKLNECLIDRIDGDFNLQTTGDNLLANITLRYVSYEHIVIFDNKSSFGDLVYDPVTGFRQNRLRVSGYKTDEWNGRLDAPGFMYNQDNIVEWSRNKFYTKGSIVKFKNRYWSAAANVQPSEEFEFQNWYKSDYNPEKAGLLPNLAQRAERFTDFYNNKTANLEQDADLLAFGLIGFKPRAYLQSLDLDDISQVGVYSEFIKNKGTLPSAEMFSRAGLNTEFANYNIYENWAIRRAIYGASANRNYVELQLDEDKLRANPATVEVLQPGVIQEADQAVFFANVYKKTAGVVDQNFLPYRDTPIKPDIELPTAGFVNIEDVDITVFSIDDIFGLTSNLEKIVAGAKIWVAKTSAYNWGIYRVSALSSPIVEVVDNLNKRANVVFSGPHNLVVNEFAIIKGFDDRINGVYKVLKRISDTAIEIDFEFIGRQTRIIGDGQGFVLKSMRVNNAANGILSLPYAKSVLPGAQVWTETDYENKWRVYEKTNSVTPLGYYTPVGINQAPTSNLGTALAQTADGASIVVGDSAANRVFVYTREGLGGYAFAASLDVPFDSTVTDLGSSVDAAGNWVLSGAPESNVVALYSNQTGEYTMAQVLAPESDSDFGCQVAVSKDSNWAFVSGPGYVCTYFKKEVAAKSNSTLIRDDHFEYNATNDVLLRVRVNVDEYLDVTPDQFVVLSDNEPLVEGVHYLVDLNAGKVVDIVFDSTLSLSLIYATVGRRITMSERTAVEGIPTPSTFLDISSTLKHATSIYALSITQGARWLKPFVDYTLSAGGDVVFGGHVQASSVVIRTATHYEFTGRTSNLEAGFGCAMAVTTDGRQVSVGAKNATVLGQPNAGKVFVYQRDVRRVILTPGHFTNGSAIIDSPYALTTFDRDQNETTFDSGTLRLVTQIKPVTLTVNGQAAEWEWDNLTSEITVSDATVGDNVVFESGTLAASHEVLVSEDPEEGAHFGASLAQCFNNCSLYVGAPFASRVADSDTLYENAGAVERFVNEAKIYGTVVSRFLTPVLFVGDSLIINKVEVTLSSGTTIASLVSDINAAKVPNARAELTADGELEIYVVNPAIAEPLTLLSVLPGRGTLFADLGLKTLPWVQTITSPRYQAGARFGATVSINESSDTLAVGAPYGSTIDATPANADRIIFDAEDNSDAIANSGAVYLFDMLPSANRDIGTSAKFVFAEQVTDNAVRPSDQYGAQVSYLNFQLVTSSPGATMYRRLNQTLTLADAIAEILIRDPYLKELEEVLSTVSSDSSSSDSSFDLEDIIEANIELYGYTRIAGAGRVVIYRNASRSQSWKVRHRQADLVDLDRINAVNVYSKSRTKVLADLDYIDPLQGKILGAARQNIDYIGAVDPAGFNVGAKNNNGRTWDSSEVGRIWWDTTNTRFIEYNQDGLAYAGKRWGQLFPGSSVDVYEWVESNTSPVDYAGGVRSESEYAIKSKLTSAGVFETKYYFWAKNGNTVHVSKTLSTNAIARYIENPQSTGIPFVALINSSTVGLFNLRDLIAARDSVLHIEFDLLKTDNNVHKEYELIAENKSDSFLSPMLYKKLVDSLSGIDQTSNQVPDRKLGIADAHGTQVRPRQSFFVDRFLALQNYLQQVNKVLRQYPIVESKQFNKLLSYDQAPTPTSGRWDREVASLTELAYQNFVDDGDGFNYLVRADESRHGRWSIYTVIGSTVEMTTVQTYNTREYWYFVDWFAIGVSATIKPAFDVAQFSDLASLTVPVGTIVRVSANSVGKWEIYQRAANSWGRIGVEKGTIAFSSALWDYASGQFGFDTDVFDSKYFDQEPTVETRKIIEAINEELFVEELAAEKNKALVLMFNYILQEQGAPDWLFKTSLVDVEHHIRELSQSKTYRRDNQDFVLDYIAEVKPYHVKVKEFSLRYNSLDIASAYATDFDLPAYYDGTLERFVSPILDDTGSLSTYASVPATDAIWTTTPYSDWFNHYRLTLATVDVTVGGTGYSIRPVVTAIGESTRPAILEARINAAGQVSRIDVVDPGEGYGSAPIIEITGGNGTGAVAVPRMTPGLVRSFDVTIKFDRVDYAPAVQQWAANTEYAANDLVRYADRVYRATAPVQSATFAFESFVEVLVDELNAVDRIAGFYKAKANELGLDIGLLLSGIDYAGVQVKGPSFVFDSGYGVASYDMTPYDAITVGPEGLPTYPDTILDTILQSDFLDSYLGTGDYQVDVAGGAFVDPYHSHAPEELMPGQMFDTLDIKVFARPGSDYEGNGHGFASNSRNFVYNGSPLDLDGLEEYPGAVYLYNASTGVGLAEGPDYSINWGTMTVTVSNNVSIDDTVTATVYGVGGGNQLHKEATVGPVTGGIVIPVEVTAITSTLVLVNGVPVIDYAVVAIDAYSSAISLADTYSSDDRITIVVFGTDTPLRDYNKPVIEVIAMTTDDSYILQGSTAGTVPADAIVEVNGLRLRPADAAEFYGDAVTTDYEIPHALNTDPSLVVGPDVRVYIDGVPQLVGTHYTITPADDSSVRYVEFITAPPAGARIVISVSTYADYIIQPSGTLSLTASAVWAPGDELRVISWNDSSQLRVITRTSTGPTTLGTTVSHAYDTVPYDLSPGGGLDYFVDATVAVNRFELGRLARDLTRLWVTLNGYRLNPGVDYNMDGTTLVLAEPTLLPTDVMVVTSLTDNVVAKPMAFRVFKDMRQTQGIYRITSETTTVLREDLLEDDVVVEVVDSSKMPAPNLDINQYGVVTINGERITYRGILGNTLTGITRGTAGTAAASHSAGDVVYDMSRRNYLNGSNPKFERAMIPVKVLRDDADRYKVLRKNDDYYVEAELISGNTRVLHHSWISLREPLVVYRTVFNVATQSFNEEIEATINAGSRAIYQEINEADPATFEVRHPTDPTIVLAQYGDDPFGEWPGLPGPGHFVGQSLSDSSVSEALQNSTSYPAQFLRNEVN